MSSPATRFLIYIHYIHTRMGGFFPKMFALFACDGCDERVYLTNNVCCVHVQIVLAQTRHPQRRQFTDRVHLGLACGDAWELCFVDLLFVQCIRSCGRCECSIIPESNGNRLVSMCLPSPRAQTNDSQRQRSAKAASTQSLH